MSKFKLSESHLETYWQCHTGSGTGSLSTTVTVDTVTRVPDTLAHTTSKLKSDDGEGNLLIYQVKNLNLRPGLY